MKDGSSCHIGDFTFPDGFESPQIDVTQEFRTTEHEIIANDARDSEYCVQTMGRKPAQISITGTVPAQSVSSLQATGQQPKPVFIQSDRWTGTAAMKSVNLVEQTNSYDGNPTSKLTLKCREIVENKYTDNALINTKWDKYGDPVNVEAPDIGLEALNIGVEAVDISGSQLTDYSKSSEWDSKYEDATYVGRLSLRDRYQHPPVDISIKSKNDEHGLLSPEGTQSRPFNLDSKGSEPDRLTINAVVPESDLSEADELGRNGRVAFDVGEPHWGTGIVKTVSTTDRNEYDDVIGEWIHNCKIELISIGYQKLISPAVFPTTP